MNWLKILGAIPEIISTVKAVEVAVPKPGQGAVKLKAVTGIIEALMSGGGLAAVISIIVELMNASGEFEKPKAPSV